ncbi:MAG: hypothetical protein OHK0017_02340 [Patescibacteria group bacterium]
MLTIEFPTKGLDIDSKEKDYVVAGNMEITKKVEAAGCFLYRINDSKIEILLIRRVWKYHPEGAYLLPKGGIEEGELNIQAALRERVKKKPGIKTS